MSDFDKAVGVILRHEGGLVDDPADPGGVTNFGISLRWARSALGYNPSDIRALTKAKASEIYREHWWVPNRYGEIDDQEVATKVFDMAVNMGSYRAVSMLQEALDHIASVFASRGGTIDRPAQRIPLEVDGELGAKTLAATNGVGSDTLLAKLIEAQETFYRSLARNRPAMAKFLPGWLKRAAWPRAAK